MSMPSLNDPCYAERCGMYETYGTVGGMMSDVALSVSLIFVLSFTVAVVLFDACIRGSN